MYDFAASPPPIVICSTKGTAFPVLAASIAAYVPPNVEIYWSTQTRMRIAKMSHTWHILPNQADNFGDAYNTVTEAALNNGHSGVIMANDDIVLDPTSYDYLAYDLAMLYRSGRKIGWVAARSNTALTYHNIRTPEPHDVWEGLYWRSEKEVIKSVPYIAPIFAWISREAYRIGKFPPISLGSDIVSCHDLSTHGYEHFVSRCYVHHVGGVSTGIDSTWPQDSAWLEEHRPDIAELIKRDLVPSV